MMTSSNKYIFIGPERTGTTWVYEYLLTRQDINLPKETKETFFFDQYYYKGINWYYRHFENIASLTVEVAPTYFKSEEAPTRIKKHIPQVKIVCSLRNPLERSVSHFNHLIRYGQSKPIFRDAVRAKPEIIEASLYFKNIARWINVFGRGNVFVLMHDKIRSDPNIFVRDLCNILNIYFLPPSNFLIAKKVNPLTSPRSIFLASLGSGVKNYFRSYQLYSVVELAKRMGLKKIFFGRESKQLNLPEKQDIENMIEIFTQDLHNLGKFLETDFNEWIHEMNKKLKLCT